MPADTRPAAVPAVPVCPVDRFPMSDTIVGWRCPFCGAAGDTEH